MSRYVVMVGAGLALWCSCGRTEPFDTTDVPDFEEFVDAGTLDAAVLDAGTPDAGPPDAGGPDAGGPDAGAPDASVPDAGAPDAGAPDAGAPDAGAPDAGAPDAGAPDAGTPDAGDPCAEFDEVLVGDLLGAITYAAGGTSLPAGRYRFIQAGGCMKYGSIGHSWTVQNPDHFDGWWAVSDGASGPATTLLFLPGTEGLAAGLGAYAVFQDCLNANANPERTAEFDFVGGRLGIWLRDAPYSDNMSQNDDFPRWRLRCVSQP